MRLCVLVTFLAASCVGQSGLHDEVMALYDNFPPGMGSKEQMAQLVRLRDFWAEAYKNPEPYISILREELANPRNPSLFHVDAANRLLQMAGTRSDRNLALRALARADVPEVGVIPYYAVVIGLARLNEDTSRAAFHLLQWPDIQMRIAAAIWGLDRLVTSLVVSTDTKYWVNAAIEHLGGESNEDAQKVLLLMLWYGQSDFADNELKAFSEEAGKPIIARAFAAELLERSNQITGGERAQALASTEEVLRQGQRDAALRMSVPNLEHFTRMLIAKRAANLGQ
jgi:hypothetical protein